MGATHFLIRPLPRVASEMALHVLAYNLTRAMNIMGIQPGSNEINRRAAGHPVRSLHRWSARCCYSVGVPLAADFVLNWQYQG